MTISEKIAKFLKADSFAVVGASTDRNKYGNKVFRCYQMKGLPVIPVNPKELIIEGVGCVAAVGDLPDSVSSISIITPPAVTDRVVTEAIARGIKNIWMQPGAESQSAIEMCVRAGVNVIADGSCILVVLGYREH